MKILFDTRTYVLDREIRRLAELSDVYILERSGINDAGGISNAKNITVENGGSKLERWLSKCGLEITLPTYIKKYRQTVSSIAPDVIVAADFFRVSSWQAIAYKKKNPSVRLILLCETKRWPKRILSRLIMKVMLRLFANNTDNVEKILVYTEEGKHFLGKLLSKTTIAVVSPVVDTDLFKPVQNREFMVNGVLRVLMNARYLDYKRHKLLIKVLKRLRGEGYKFQLNFISRDEQGRDKIKMFVHQEGLDNVVNFLSPAPVNSLVDLINTTDLLVLPSYNEALGMVVPETMACGVPTVTSDTVGANVYVIPNRTGLIFKTDDADDLYNSLLCCFNQEKLIDMGQAAREHILTNHSLKYHVDDLSKHLL